MKQTVADRGMLVVILTAIFVVPGSISGTAVALPAIGADLQAPLTSLQWVVNAFNLMFACCTLVWGALADRYGRKRCFLGGVLLYSVASLASALATAPWLLDLARALAGVGAAAIFSCGIAILSTHFDGSARMRAFALFGTVAGLGVSLGPTLSGLLLDSSNWRAIFWCHTAALSLVLLGSPLLPADRPASKHSGRFDSTGALLFILAMLALMTAIVQGSNWGWLSRGVATLLGGCALLLALFVRHERRQSQPMLDLSLLANRGFVGMALVTVAASFGFVTLLTYLPSYLAGVQALPPTQSGLAMLLLTAPMLVCPLLAGKLLGRGMRAETVLGSSLLALLAGVVLLAVACRPGVPLWQLSVPLWLVGAGMGLSAGLVDGLALKAVPEDKAGMAAGLLNTFRLGSEAVAVACYGALLATRLDVHLGTRLAALAQDNLQLRRWLDEVAAGNLNGPAQTLPTGIEQAGALLAAGYDRAFHDVLWLLASMVLLLSLLIAWLIRPRKAAIPATQAA